MLNRVNMIVLSLLLFLVVGPALAGLILFNEYMDGNANPLRPSFWRGVFRGELGPGDLLIYRKTKVSPKPGPRARNVSPAAGGEQFQYEVEKFWAVRDVLKDGRVLAVTRTGKELYLTKEDERLRKARLLERLRYRGQFPSVEAA
jgi:hypothetical protein